jgi:hypothetical protein
MRSPWQTTVMELERVLQESLQALELREQQLLDAESRYPSSPGLQRVPAMDPRWQERLSASSKAMNEIEGQLRAQAIAWQDWQKAGAAWRALLQQFHALGSVPPRADPGPRDIPLGMQVSEAPLESSDGNVHRDSPSSGEIDPLRGA